MSPTLSLRSSSTTSWAVGSAGDSLTGPDLFGEDLLHRRALLVARDLPLRRVPLGDREPRRSPELVGDRLHPFDELLDPRPRRDRLSALEVDQLSREAEADRAPEVLLEQPVRPRRERLALVERARDACGQRVDERDKRARLGEIGLCVADADLDRREDEMRADAPPDLGVLVDRARLVEEADVALPVVPAVEPVGNPAAREHAREDLRPRGVQIREHALNEGRARRQGEQLGQVVAEGAAHADRAVRIVDPDVHVDPERVVPPDDVAQQLVVPSVVGSVDDPLLLPRAPWMGAGRGKAYSERIRQRAKLRAPFADALHAVDEGLAAPGAHLRLGRDQLADEMRLELGADGRLLDLLEAADEAEGGGIEQREL